MEELAATSDMYTYFDMIFFLFIFVNTTYIGQLKSEYIRRFFFIIIIF